MADEESAREGRQYENWGSEFSNAAAQVEELKRERDEAQREREDWKQAAYTHVETIGILDKRMQSAEYQLAAAQAETRGADERARMLLKAKNEWADRARAAQEQIRRLRALHHVFILPGSNEPYVGQDYKQHCAECHRVWPCPTAALLADQPGGKR